MGDSVLAEFASAANAVELQQQMAVANDGASKDRRIALRVCAEAKYPVPRDVERGSKIFDIASKKSVESPNPTSSALREAEQTPSLRPELRQSLML